MYLLGTIIILSGIAAALVATVGYGLVTRGNTAALAYGRIGTRVSFGAVALVVVLLSYLFVAQRYDIKYVYDYSSKELEFGFRVAAMWAGQPGSFIVWVLWGLVAAQFLVRRTRHAEPYVLSILMGLQAALLVFMLIRNPFIPHLDASGGPVIPADGKGLNPTLHNPWMIIHPPILFVGYALLAVPFAFALGGLWRRDYDGWAQAAIPWTLAGWAFLGLALLLGGYWAYETLGWGGYWGWDPVENAALVPWLTATALLHSLLLQRTHGSMRRTNFILAILTYILVFYASFLTRTGVLSSFSVHSFVEEGLKWIMTGFLGVLAVGAIALMAVRWRDIPSKHLSEKLLSRDSFFVLGIMGLLVIATVVLLGTSMPLISAVPGVGHSLQNVFGGVFELDDGTRYNPDATPFTDGRFGLVESFYSTTVPPLSIILVVLMIVGPLLGWRDTNVRHLLRALRWPALVSVLAMCGVIGFVAWSGRELQLLPLAYVGLATFALGTNILMIIRTVKSGWLRIGGYLAHVGMMLMIAGIVGSSSYASPEQRIVVPEGESIEAYGYTFAFNGWNVTEDGKGALNLTVYNEGTAFTAAPQLYFNQRMGATMATPAIQSQPLYDLYITPAEYMPGQDQNTAELGVNDKRELGPYTITFLGFDAKEAHEGGDAEIGAKLRVAYEGKETEVTPRLILRTNETDPSKAVESAPVELAGGHNASFVTFDPIRRMVIVLVDGLNLPVEPSKAVLTVSIKPGIKLVWLGVIVGVLGGFIAVIRRTLEGQAKLSGKRMPLPGRLGKRQSGVPGGLPGNAATSLPLTKQSK
jgi:cytochrome c-type biogenesis protein CcmF